MKKEGMSGLLIILMLISVGSVIAESNDTEAVNETIEDTDTSEIEEEICGDGICQESETCDIDCCEAFCTLECPAGAVQGSCGCECIAVVPEPPIGKQCAEGMVKYYECPDGTKIPECTCDEWGWVCKESIENDCPDIGVEPKTCAAKLKITFDKNSYFVGEEFKVIMEILDEQGNSLPHYSFHIQVYDYENGVWKEIGQDKTGSGGSRTHRDKINVNEPSRFGKNKFKMSTKVSGCPLVENTAIIEIKRKEKEKPVPCGMGNCVPEEEAEEVKAIPEDKIFYKCNGCELEDKCYPMGYRKEGNYCSEDYEFVKQNEKVCENNFECKSNICVSGECVGEGLIKKILKWFRKLFGGEEDEDEPMEKVCSKLLIEKNIGEYEYEKSLYGEGGHIKEQTQAPLYSEDGEHIGTIKCCAAVYKDEEDVEHGVLFCPYDNKEDVTNSVKWLIAKERNIIFKEYGDEKVFGDNNGQIVAWINNAYLIAVGVGPLNERHLPLPEDIADAYLKKYPSELELTKNDIPSAPPERPWEYCTDEDEKKGNKCKNKAGRLQTDPHPEGKNCEVYKGCILPDEKCEDIDDVKEKEDCYVRVAEMTGDSSVCKRITSDESRRNKCYVKAAEFTKDISICEKITEDDIKKMCLELAEIFPWEVCTSKNDMLKEECHFFDDFENGLEKWTFSSEGAGSEVVENGNTVLKLVGVERANVHKIWDNYLFKFRFKMIDGSVHVDFRRSEGYADGARRYLVGMNYVGVYNLNKQIGEDWRKLEEVDFRLDDGWHTLEIRGYDDIINVYVNDELIIKHKDTTNTLSSGWVRFEAHTGGVPGMVPELLIDDVEIKLITEEDIVYP